MPGARSKEQGARSVNCCRFPHILAGRVRERQRGKRETTCDRWRLRGPQKHRKPEIEVEKGGDGEEANTEFHQSILKLPYYQKTETNTSV